MSTEPTEPTEPLTSTWTAYMAVSVLVEAPDYQAATAAARAAFEAIEMPDGARLCTRITDPHLGSPMTNGMTLPTETMRSRVAHRRARKPLNEYDDHDTGSDLPDLVECPTCTADMVPGGPCQYCRVIFAGEDGLIEMGRGWSRPGPNFP